jgi:hypothetical protein
MQRNISSIAINYRNDVVCFRSSSEIIADVNHFANTN